MIKQPSRYDEMTDPQARPRYTGVATFFRAPYTQDLTETDIGLIGVPFDGGVTNRTGTRHGPRAVRDQSSLLRRINAATGVQPFVIARVRDLGDSWIEQPFALEPALDEIALSSALVSRHSPSAVTIPSRSPSSAPSPPTAPSE
jgi:guanidinopropionase